MDSALATTAAQPEPATAGIPERFPAVGAPGLPGLRGQRVGQPHGMVVQGDGRVPGEQLARTGRALQPPRRRREAARPVSAASVTGHAAGAPGAPGLVDAGSVACMARTIAPGRNRRDDRPGAASMTVCIAAAFRPAVRRRSRPAVR